MADAPAAPKGEIKLPGLGKVSKKTLAIAGIAGGGVLAYAYYRHSKNSAAAGSSAADSGTAADTSGNIDPVTGYPYGSPQDTEALAAQQDSGLNTNLGDTGNTDPLTGYPYGSPEDEQALQQMGYETGGGGSTSTGTGTATTNAEWEQQAIADLEAGGVSQATVTDAESGLPRYLAKLKLSSAQASAVQMAVGLAGPPPVGGPYSIIPEPAPAPKGGGGGGKGGGGTGSGKPAAPAGLRAVPGKTSAKVTWHKAAGATGYDVTREGIGAAHVTGTSHTFTGLKSRARYTWKVTAKNAHGYSADATSSFTTT